LTMIINWKNKFIKKWIIEIIKNLKICPYKSSYDSITNLSLLFKYFFFTNIWTAKINKFTYFTIVY